MKIPDQYKCDHPGCEQVRTESNHWWLISYLTRSIEIQPWPEKYEYRKNHTHYCGQEHTLSALSRWMGEQNREAAFEPTTSERQPAAE